MKKTTALQSRPVLAEVSSIGLDLGNDTSTYCVLDRAGDVIDRGAFVTSEKELGKLAKRWGRCVVMLEACGQAGWVTRFLRTKGPRVIMANPRKLKMISESHKKTDKLDAEALARLARLSQLDARLVRPVEVRTKETELLRSRLRVREQLVAMRVRSINLVRSVIRGQGVKLPKLKPENFAAGVAEAEIPSDIFEVVESLLPVIADFTQRIKTMERELRLVAKRYPVTDRLQEIDGVGLLTSLAFVLCIEDPGRFESSKDVGPYLGLTPSIRQSSTMERRGRITKMGDSGVRRLLVQAAHSMLRSKRESALKNWALRLMQRRDRKKAVVGLARKLAIVMHQVWVSGCDYQCFPMQPARIQVPA